MKRPRLAMLKPGLSSLPPRLGPIPGDERSRDKYRQQQQPWRRWYHSKPWQKLRWKILTRDRFTCQMGGCGKVETDTSKLVCDHRQPHKGDEVLFWSESNLQCLCKPCHDATKQSQEATGIRKGVGIDGRPIDSNHVWNRDRQGGGWS